MILRSLIRGARRLRGKGEELALNGALFGGAGCLVAAGWTVAPAAGLAVLGLLLLIGAVLRVAGVGESGPS